MRAPRRRRRTARGTYGRGTERGTSARKSSRFGRLSSIHPARGGGRAGGGRSREGFAIPIQLGRLLPAFPSQPPIAHSLSLSLSLCLPPAANRQDSRAKRSTSREGGKRRGVRRRGRGGGGTAAAAAAEAASKVYKKERECATERSRRRTRLLWH
jgi:hypothetical protein